MRRLWLALLAVSVLAPAAQAKQLVVVEKFNYAGYAKQYGQVWADTLGACVNGQQDRLIAAWFDEMDKTNANYKRVWAWEMKTDWARRSVFPTGPTTEEQFDGTIILNANFLANATPSTWRPNPPTDPATVWNPCSLTVAKTAGGTISYPTRPLMFIFGANEFNADSVGRAITVPNQGSVVCSTGVAAYNSNPSLNGSAAMVLGNGYGVGPWLSASNKVQTGAGKWGYLLRSATPGGVRALLVDRTHPVLYNYPTCIACDSLRSTTTTDSCFAWERLIGAANLAPGANPNTRISFANVMSSAPCIDSTDAVFNMVYAGSHHGNWGGIGVGDRYPCEFDDVDALWMLAHQDSLTGGKVWDKPTGLRPVQASVVIEGAFSRGARRFAGGSLPSDSTTHKTSIATDLRSLNIPYTVCANMDSVATYPNELAWWSVLPRVRYAPVAWAGLRINSDGVRDTANGVCGLITTLHPVDVFGRYRSRIAVGDGTYTGADTGSVKSGLIMLRRQAKAYWPDQVSGLCVAPMDDYSPKNMLWQGGPGPDSILYAVGSAGFTALLTDVRGGDARPGIYAGNRDLLRGYWDTQGTYYSRLLGRPFKIVGQTGYSVGGSEWSTVPYQNNFYTPVDSSTDYGSAFASGAGQSNVPIYFITAARWWHGLVHDSFTDPDWFGGVGFRMATTGVWNTDWDIVRPLDDRLYPMRHASVLKMHVSDFGPGSATRWDITGAPMAPLRRPGWWALKSMYNAFSAINAAAQRPVCQFVWPEDLNP